MSFETLRNLVSELSGSVNGATGRENLVPITLQAPVMPLDEAHFLRLTAWCYAFFYETGTPTLRHLTSLVRSQDATSGNIIQECQESTHNLRTTQSHNLSNSKGDEKKRRQSDIWMQTNGGTPFDWEKCCIAMNDGVAQVVRIFNSTWIESISTDADRDIAIGQLVMAAEQKWEAHNFDRIIEKVVESLSITDFDAASYRKIRLAKWQELVKCFENRESCEIGISRAIEAELKMLFGSEVA